MKFSDETDEATKRAVAEKNGIASIKFGDIINHYLKDCIFDFDKFMASEGKTGVYLLYMVARINSILKKAEGIVPVDVKLIGAYSQSESELILKFALIDNAFISAYNEKAPNAVRLCNHQRPSEKHLDTLAIDTV